MINHIIYFKKSDDFWALRLIIYDFLKKVRQCCTFLINLCDFFSNFNRVGAFNQSKIGNEDAASFQNKMDSKFQKRER